MSTVAKTGVPHSESGRKQLSMVVVMGTTGAGKSYLINQLAGYKAVEEGASLDSCRFGEHSRLGPPADA